MNAVAEELRERARVRLASAGSRALHRGDLPAALNLFQRSAKLAIGHADQAELFTRVGGLLTQLGQLAEAEALFEQALEDARADGDDLRAARADSSGSSSSSRPTPPGGAVRSSS